MAGRARAADALGRAYDYIAAKWKKKESILSSGAATLVTKKLFSYGEGKSCVKKIFVFPKV